MTVQSSLSSLLSLACIVLQVACTSVQADSQSGSSHDSKETKVSGLTISFDFHRGGIASSQYAVWIETLQGELVRTLYATSFTALGGYSYREDALPVWVKKSSVSKLSRSRVDALTGATPQSGRVTYHWDGTDDNGKQLPAATYRFCVEGTCYWKSRVLFSGDVVWKGHAQPEIRIEEQRFQAGETNANMISQVSACYY